MKILVVEDDHLLNSTLCYNLSASGFRKDKSRGGGMLQGARI